MYFLGSSKLFSEVPVAKFTIDSHRQRLRHTHIPWLTLGRENEASPSSARHRAAGGGLGLKEKRGLGTETE